MGNRNNAKAKLNGAASMAADDAHSLISNQKLLALYRGLVACSRQISNANGKSPSIRGHEAALVGATIDLGPGDVVCSRDHGVRTGFCDGTAIPTLLLQPGNQLSRETRNGKTALNRGNGTSAAEAELAYTHAAIGTALAHKTNINRKVAVVFSSAESADMLREAVHIAVLNALPMVFVHQPEGDREKRERARKNVSRFETPWFPSITVDRHDVVALYRVAFEAISRARLGRGPTLIECRPYRVKNGRRATDNDFHADDPIVLMEHYLRAKGLLDSKL